MNILPEVLAIAKIVESWIRAGSSAEEIQERIANPDGLIAQHLRNAADRRRRGEAYLGIDVEVELDEDDDPDQ